MRLEERRAARWSLLCEFGAKGGVEEGVVELWLHFSCISRPLTPGSKSNQSAWRLPDNNDCLVSVYILM